MRKKHKNRLNGTLIVALDTPTLEGAEKLIKSLKGIVSYYKIGLEFFTAHGWEAVRLVKKYKARVFLDLKLHDIPNTVAKTVDVACRNNIDMLNVHALGGLEMMRKAKEVINEFPKNKRPALIGVTILTSHSEDTLSKELGIKYSIKKEVSLLAEKVKKAGLDGVVCSPLEAKWIRKRFSKNFAIVTPGIRPKGSNKNDQKRINAPKDALKAGSNYLVVGRPITEAKDPRTQAELILLEMNG